MPGRETAVPEGRTVSAPETPHQGHSSSAAGAVPVRLAAPSLAATVVVNPTAPAAYAVISGDKSDEVSIAWEDGFWTLRWPEDAGVTPVSYGSFHIGNVQFNSSGIGGAVYVNGRRVDGMTGGAVKEQPAVCLILPPGCSLYAELQSGDVEIPPPADERHGLTLVSLSSQSAGLYAGCAVGEVILSTQSGGCVIDGYTGPVNVSTMSGSIDLAHAAGNVQAETMSGGVHVHCEQSVLVSASSMSGPVRVTAAEGAEPTGSGSSMTGFVSLPPSMGGGRKRRGW